MLVWNYDERQIFYNKEKLFKSLSGRKKGFLSHSMEWVLQNMEKLVLTMLVFYKLWTTTSTPTSTSLLLNSSSFVYHELHKLDYGLQKLRISMYSKMMLLCALCEWWAFRVSQKLAFISSFWLNIFRKSAFYHFRIRTNSQRVYTFLWLENFPVNCKRRLLSGYCIWNLKKLNLFSNYLNKNN